MVEWNVGPRNICFSTAVVTTVACVISMRQAWVWGWWSRWVITVRASHMTMQQWRITHNLVDFINASDLNCCYAETIVSETSKAVKWERILKGI
jgi:hypothetical protein